MANRPWDVNRQILYKILKTYRKDAGITQKELAESLSKPQSYVAKYEIGERKLDFVEVATVCEKLSVSLIELSASYLEFTKK